MNRFSLRQLTYFCATAEAGTIAGAARNLNISGAAISAAIDALEDISGCTLFERTPAKGMRLTTSGTLLEAEARTVLAAANKWEQNARYLRSDTTGHLRLGSYHALSCVFGLPIYMRNRSLWPRVTLQIVQASLGGLLSQLDAGDLDLLLIYEAQFDRNVYDVIDIGSLRPKVVLPEHHPLSKRKRLRLSDLEGLPFVQILDDLHRPTSLDRIRARGIRPEISFSSSSYELVRSAIGKELGFTISPLQPANPMTYHGDRLATVPLDEDLGGYHIVTVCRKGRAAEPLIRNLIESCRITIDSNTDGSVDRVPDRLDLPNELPATQE